MISSYYNAAIILKRKTGTTDTGAAILSTGKSINVHLDYSRRIVLDAQGNEVVSEMQIMTADPIASGDVIVVDGRNCTVLKAYPVFGLRGKIMQYEAYT